MTKPCKFAKNTRWGHTDHMKITPQRHPKQLNLTEAYLFDLLPTVILTDIEIWVSGLEHCDRFKAIVSRINFMYNPILFAIPHELWTPYHNFGVYRYYNAGFYK